MKKKQIIKENSRDSGPKAEIPAASSQYPYQKYIALLSVIPILIFFKTQFEYTLNIPWYDDYDSILGYLLKWKELPASEKFMSIFQQHNEHRILPSRVLYILYYAVMGKINIAHIVYLANFQLLIIWGIFSYFAFLHMRSVWGWAFLISGLMIFDFSNYSNSYFAMAGIANYGVIMFFFLSLFCFQRSSAQWIIGGVLFQFLCVFSTGNGVLGAFGIFLFNLIGRQKSKAIISLAGAILFSAAYYLHYQSIPNTLKGDSVQTMALFYMYLTGSHWGIDNRLIIGVLLSLAILSSVLFSFRHSRGVASQNAFSFACFFFLLASIATISVFRSGVRENVETSSYVSRYLIIPHLLTLASFLFLFLLFHSKKVIRLIVPVALLLAIKAYSTNYNSGMEGVESVNSQLLTRPYCYTFSAQEHAGEIENEACKKGIYCRE